MQRYGSDMGSPRINRGVEILAEAGELKNRETIRKGIFSLIAGFIVAFCYVAGYRLDRFDSLDFMDKAFYFKWAAATVVISVIIAAFWQAVDWGSRKWEKKEAVKDTGTGKARLAGAVFLFLCWVPALLAVFPGVFAYDAFDEWEQVHKWMLTAHHPVAHVLLLGGLVEGFYCLTGNYNVGIAVYSILQMLILAWALSAVIGFMSEFAVPRIWRIISVIFYAVSPVIQLFSICATKDVLFTGAELIFFLYVIRFSVNGKLAGDTKGMGCFGAAAFCTMVFRNNGLYIVLLTLLVLLVACRRRWKNHKKNIVIFLMVIFVPYFLYTGPVYRGLDVKPGGVEEMLSVPLQQMARVYRYDFDSLSGEDLEILYRFVEKEALEQYRPTVSDPVKQGFRREEFREHKWDFLGLWVRLGIDHPLTYVNSFLINTVDAWYPHALIDGYRHGDGRGSYFDYRVAPPGEEKVFLQGLHDFFETLSHDLQAQSKPLAFLMLSPGWYFLCTVLLFFYFWSRRKYGVLLAMSVFVFHMITVLLGPMALVRYMLLFFVALPVVCAVAFFPKGFEQKDEIF